MRILYPVRVARVVCRLRFRAGMAPWAHILMSKVHRHTIQIQEDWRASVFSVIESNTGRQIQLHVQMRLVCRLRYCTLHSLHRVKQGAVKFAYFVLRPCLAATSKQ